MKVGHVIVKVGHVIMKADHVIMFVSQWVLQLKLAAFTA